jgi:hypothetical protein
VDQSSLVAIGKVILDGLQAEKFGVDAALWVRADWEEPWRLWLAPKIFMGPHDFFAALAKVLTKYRVQTGYFEISNVRPIEPNSPFLAELKSYGRVRPDRPVPLLGDYIGGTYIKEGLLLFQEI